MQKKLEYAVRFTHFCLNENVDPADLAELVSLVQKEVAYSVRECNGEPVSSRSKNITKRLEAKAKEMGYGIERFGLVPSLAKDGRHIHLPVEG